MFWNEFERFGVKPALCTAREIVSYSELASRCNLYNESFKLQKSIVLVAMDNSIESIVAFYAALRNNHAAMICDYENTRLFEQLKQKYQPEFSWTPDGGLNKAQQSPRKIAIHPDLGMLVSTSGSTGNSKCVRIPYKALHGNASSIAQYQNLTPLEHAGLILPLHYCFGLSVLNSHLLKGAQISLDCPAADHEDFFDFIKLRSITSLSGVPYTFETLDRRQFFQEDLPSLKYMAQAGGKLKASLVKKFGQWAKDQQKRFFVMYGQTEATARIAYMPPEKLLDHPKAIGIAIPNGELWLESESRKISTIDTPGELIYKGPNVMMGYSESSHDLGEGYVVEHLKTGDIACLDSSGYFYIVGRLKRFVKIYGKRFNLDDIERFTQTIDSTAICTSVDETLIIASENHLQQQVVLKVSERFNISSLYIETLEVESIPRMNSGKTDYQSISKIYTEKKSQSSRSKPVSQQDRLELLVDLYKRCFPSCEVTKEDSFINLGGNSLKYVKVSIELENILECLPEKWETRSLEDLSNEAINHCSINKKINPFTPTSIETGIFLRFVAILMIVQGHHTNVLKGAAIVLFSICGYNFGRFQLPGLLKGGQFKSLLLSWWGAFLIPYFGLLLLRDFKASSDPERSVNWTAYALIENFFEPGFNGFYSWFIQALVQTLLLVSIPLLIPKIREWVRTNTVAYFLFMLGLGLAWRLIDEKFFLTEDYRSPDQRTAWSFWCFAIGGIITSVRQMSGKIFCQIGIVCLAPLFFEGSRSIIYPFFLTLLIWRPVVTLPRFLVPVVQTIAGASLFIYLFHLNGIVGGFADPNDSTDIIIKTIKGIGQGILVWLIYDKILLPILRTSRSKITLTARNLIQRNPTMSY